ncbi:Abi family protein [Moraxella nasovis]|uniref:Abi family protein n=1 Tax=Moraxella nasovis TaxID=2904121 RepID=UPI001F614405|nr:Abi family protein [Moraxella nasovis]UNU72562.1 Abi family protein [Moraxella nasovis]
MKLSNMKPIKTWKSFDEQIEILQKRGLIIDDVNKSLGYLRMIGYYRLSGYLYSFRQIDKNNPKTRLDDFIIGSTFQDVKALYVFDKKLRQLALDALERIEIALRVNIAHTLGRYDPLAYKNSVCFSNKFDHNKWLNKHQELIKRHKDNSFVKHHLQHYADFPIWAVCEVWDFGTMSKLYQGMKSQDKNQIAKLYNLADGKVLQTHLHAFNFIRNVSAHHSRLWNKPIVFKANLKGFDGQWRQLPIEKPFVYFCLMKRMLDVICPNSTWGERFLALLEEFPQVENGAISLEQMGVIAN